MTVTFVIPAYNAEKFLREAIDSVRAQTVSDWKLIVVNDGSTDSTAAIIDEYVAADPRISRADMPSCSGSAYRPRIHGIELASTEFVCPLDADDVIPPNYLEELLKRPTSDMVYPTMCTIDGQRITPPDGSLLYGPPIKGAECVKLTLDGWLMGANGGLIRKDIYLKASQEIQSEKSSFIYTDEFHTRVILNIASRVCASKVQYYYRMNDESVTHLQSARKFENYLVNLALIEFCREKYGEDSEEYMLAHRQNFHWVFGAMRQLNRQKFTAADRKIAQGYIRQAIAAVDFALIKPHVSPRYYALMRCHRFLPMRRVLALIDNIDKLLGT